MKHSAVLTFAALAAYCLVVSQSASSRYGEKTINDKLIYQEFVVIGPSWWRKVTKDVVYPPPGYVNEKTISAVYAIDQTGGKNTSTGYASLTDGGPGFKHVKVHLKSQFRGGLNFTVEVYGSRGY